MLRKACVLLVVVAVQICFGSGVAPLKLAVHPTSSSAITPVTSATDGPGYFTQISIGASKQPFIVTVDTGSSDLLIPIVGCSPYECGAHANAYYDPSSATPLPCAQCPNDYAKCSNGVCQFGDQYGDGTQLKGALYTDTVTWGQYSGTAWVGGIDYQSVGGDFSEGEVDGIMGLAFPAVSAFGGYSAMYDVLTANGVPPVFAMCLTPSTGGAISLGGVLPDMVDRNTMRYVPIIDESYYVVNLTAISINGNVVEGFAPEEFGQSIIDSGTTLIVLPQTVYSHVYKALCVALGAHSKTDCLGQTVLSLEDFPTIGFVLSGQHFTIEPENYMMPYEGGYFFGISPLQSDQPVTILGDRFMSAFTIEFNQANATLGIASQPPCGCQFELMPLPEASTTQQYVTPACGADYAYTVPGEGDVAVTLAIFNVGTVTLFVTNGAETWNSTVEGVATNYTEHLSSSVTFSSNSEPVEVLTVIVVPAAKAQVGSTLTISVKAGMENPRAVVYNLYAYSTFGSVALVNGVEQAGVVVEGLPGAFLFTAPAGSGGAYFSNTMGGNATVTFINVQNETVSVRIVEEFQMFLSGVDYTAAATFTVSLTATDTFTFVCITATAWIPLAEATNATGYVTSATGIVSYGYWACDASSLVEVVYDALPGAALDIISFVPSTPNLTFTDNGFNLPPPLEAGLYLIQIISSRLGDPTAPFIYGVQATRSNPNGLPSLLNGTAVTSTLCPGCCATYQATMPDTFDHVTFVSEGATAYTSCAFADPAPGHALGSATVGYKTAGCPQLDLPGSQKLVYVAVFNTNLQQPTTFTLTALIYGSPEMPLWVFIFLVVLGGLLVVAGGVAMVVYCLSSRRRYLPLESY